MPKQMEIPGTERKRLPSLDKAVEEYRELRDARMKLTEKEVLAKDKLKKLMQKNQLTAYVYESDEVDEETEKPILFDVTFDAEPDVKVRKHKEKKQPEPEPEPEREGESGD